MKYIIALLLFFFLAVHIQRMCLLWLTRFPKHLAGIELRQLVLQIMAIKTENDRLYWTRHFSAWHERHKVYW